MNYSITEIDMSDAPYRYKVFLDIPDEELIKFRILGTLDEQVKEVVNSLPISKDHYHKFADYPDCNIYLRLCAMVFIREISTVATYTCTNVIVKTLRE